jgi:hypothetical protein
MSQVAIRFGHFSKCLSNLLCKTWQPQAGQRAIGFGFALAFFLRFVGDCGVGTADSEDLIPVELAQPFIAPCAWQYCVINAFRRLLILAHLRAFGQNS